MAIINKNRVRKEVDDASVAEWEKQGWVVAGKKPAEPKPAMKLKIEPEVVDETNNIKDE